MAAAATSSTVLSDRTCFIPSQTTHFAPLPQTLLFSKRRPSASTLSRRFEHQPSYHPKPNLCSSLSAAAGAATGDLDSSSAVAPIHGPCYVLGDNIDTDQIIPAEYLTLVPSNPDEYKKLGSYALIGLPSATYSTPFIEPSAIATRFPIIIAGANFGCGSSREHAPVALGAAGVKAVVAESFARIFFRNSVATGEVYPIELEDVGLFKEFTTGDIVTVDLAESKLINHTTGKDYILKPIGDAGPVIEAGGIFAYARKTGMISSAP